MRPAVNLLPVLLRWRWRGATVVTFHDLRVPYLFPKAGPVREWANRLLARGADGVVATNDEDYERLRGWGVRNLRLIPIGSNIADCPPANYKREAWREAHGVGPHTTLLAYFGFLSSTKGLDDLMRALAVLKGRGEYRLIMVGGGLGASDPTNRATAQELDALGESLGVRDELIWTGYLEPPGVSAALHGADMAVLPYSDGASFRRGSLLAVLEHGLPVVTTNPTTSSSTALPRLESGRNCLLVPAGDASALAEAVAAMAHNDALRARLGEGARRLAKAFDWGTIARAHRQLYSEVKGRG
jgi:glycosyltransferase involved in cell wall biosynthesis